MILMWLCNTDLLVGFTLISSPQPLDLTTSLARVIWCQIFYKHTSIKDTCGGRFICFFLGFWVDFVSTTAQHAHLPYLWVCARVRAVPLHIFSFLWFCSDPIRLFFKKFSHDLHRPKSLLKFCASSHVRRCMEFHLKSPLDQWCASCELARIHQKLQ